MIKEPKLLKPGEYTLPEGHVLIRTGGRITVRLRKNINNVKNPFHCGDCKYFGTGRTHRGSWLGEVPCCTKRVKKNGLYYVTYEVSLVCNDFEKKEEESK